ncbi:MAG: thioredoxin-like domain-containing protein [Bacteroidota bacterium]
MKKSVFLILLLMIPALFVSASPAKKAYRIKVKISDLKDTVCFLANYFGDKTYLQDTAKIDKDGKFEFSGDEPLARGIYIIAKGNKRLFEFLIDKSQSFSIETQGEDYVKNMKFKDSPENTWFYDYLRFNSKKYEETEPWLKLQKTVKNNKDSIALIKRKLEAENKEVENYKLDFIKAHGDAFMSHFFLAMKDPVLPEAPLKPDGKRDSVYLFHWYKDHYWDNTDLNDDALLRTPFFHSKIVTYFDKLIIQQPDTLIIEIDKMIDRVRSNKEMFKYFVWYLTNWSEISQIMTFDKIFVHMVETYYVTGQAYWVNPTVLENLTKKARQWKPILVGQPAPNMVMLDSNLRPSALLAVKAKYTIIYFWDPECGHCKVESPKLSAFYHEKKDKYGVEVFSVCSDTNMVKMKEYIKKNKFDWINVNGPRTLTVNYHDLYNITATPVVYILDEKKTIIAKKLSVDQIGDFLDRWEKFQAEDKTGTKK